MNGRNEFSVFVFIGLLSGLIVGALAYQITLIHINNECEKELLRRNEPRGIVCVTKIQSIVTSNGDEQ
ncbi:MAG: hypothetical protein HRT70_09955 [Flavobacteriaceae bacterium]|nr:hypothetical protein [Flavobacteriaceae bacterium]